MSLSCCPRPDEAAPWQPLTGVQRVGRLVAAAGWPLAMAATPLWLQSGWGPTCGFRALTGLPCPLCGGTHACAALVQGDWVGAWAAHPGALGVLALASLWVLQWLAEGLVGVRRVQPWPWQRAAAVRGVVAALLLAWAASLVGWR